MDQETRYISGAYLEANPDWHQSDAPWKADQIIKILRCWEHQPGSVCDVGCGAGGVLASLQAHMPDCSYIGLDISPQAITMAQVYANAGLRFRESALPDEGEKFDLVLAIDVFEHVPDYLRFLTDLRQFGHSFIFHIPLDISALSVLREWPILRRRRESGHLHHFTKNIALDTLTQCGYVLDEVIYTASGSQPPDRSLKGAIRDLPGKIFFRLSPDAAVRFFGGYSLLVRAHPETPA